jgi:hypothetical protein
MSERKIRYVIDDGAAFSLHGEGLTIRAVTRKSEVPVTVEVEGLSRKVLLQFQAAIEQELARREEHWKHERERVLQKSLEQATAVEHRETPQAGV